MEGFMHVLAILLSVLCLPVFAMTEITTTIYDIDYGRNPDEETLIFLGTGQVAKLHQSSDLLSTKTNLNQIRKQWYAIELDDDRYIMKISPVKSPNYLKSQNEIEENFIQQYVPTTIASMDVAKKYFREARYNPKESQCFNRALIWVYEWWKGHSLRSNKLFIYFTRTYIRRYNFEWWFHVAPLVHVMDNGRVVERMMDVKYSRGPLEIGKWTNLFMRNDAPCRVITKYSEYADFPYTGECYIQRTHMFTYQPADLQMYEAWGYSKDKFNMDEVRGAYLEAYDEQI